MGAKDFGSIERDYAFFMAHATEAENDAAEYAHELAGFAAGGVSIRLLDFGCGAGAFTQRLLTAVNWPPRALVITLVEPVRVQLDEAARRLASFSTSPITTDQKLPAGGAARFDVVLANHVLYYVDNLDATLRQMIAALLPGGKLLAAIAGSDNALMTLWKLGFAMLDRPVPYYAAEDVEAMLSQLGAAFRKSPSHYQLRFPDSRENRLKILRFLFGENLQAFSPQQSGSLLTEFDRYVRQRDVEVNTHSFHFTVEPA